MSSRRHLLTMFAKAPVPGKVKTRLQPPLTPRQAAELHAAFLRDQATRLLIGETLPCCDGRASVAGDIDHPVIAEMRGAGVEVVAQRGTTLGDRMAIAIEEGLEAGYASVTLIGSDSPTLPAQMITDAQDMVASGDVAVTFIPSFDGGFVAITTRIALPELRSPITWSVETTLAETVTAIRASKHLVGQLGFWYDVDQVEDLHFLARHLKILGKGSESFAPHTARQLAATPFS